MRNDACAGALQRHRFIGPRPPFADCFAACRAHQGHHQQHAVSGKGRSAVSQFTGWNHPSCPENEAPRVLLQVLGGDAASMAQRYDALFLPGGHGICMDGSDNSQLKQLIEAFWGAGKVVSAGMPSVAACSCSLTFVCNSLFLSTVQLLSLPPHKIHHSVPWARRPGVGLCGKRGAHRQGSGGHGFQRQRRGGRERSSQPGLPRVHAQRQGL